MAKPATRTPRSEIELVNRQRSYRFDRRRLASVARAVLEAEAAGPAQVEIAVVGDAEMARLNWQFLRHRGPTDVLSFDLTDATEAGGRVFQIIVSADTARRQARRLGHPIFSELALYVTHGLLHVLGYDDHAPADRKRMWSRQAELSRQLGLRLAR